MTIKKAEIVRWGAALVFPLIPCFGANAQATSRPPLIVQQVDESKRITLFGNTRHEVTAQQDRGRIADNFPLDHLLLQLKRSPDQETELRQFLSDLQDPKSPDYHQWITAQQFGERFGTAEQDLVILQGWLESRGFTVNHIHPNGMLMDFSGTAGQVRQAFHTEIHNLDVAGKKHIANMSDPQIPAALGPVVEGVVSLHDFVPRPLNAPRTTSYTFSAGNYTAVVPADLATIYNFNPLYAAHLSGQGQTIVVLEDSNVYSTADWATFRSRLGLSNYTAGSLLQVHPGGPGGNCADPGANADDVEAEIDVEWASAAAPSATIELASCANTQTNFGGFIALQNLLAAPNPPAIVSISYGASETQLGAAGNAYINNLYATAVAAGVSIFVAAGDEGAASTDAGGSSASHGITVSGYASTPNNVAVGGTDFRDTFAGTTSTYWNSTNSAAFGSAKSYIPEIPWNDSCASELLATYLGYQTTFGASGLCNSYSADQDRLLTVTAGSGGPSNCATGTSSSGSANGTCQGYPKPAWQSVVGNPGDGVRDIPDVALFAADGLWGHYYVVCYSDPASNRGGASCSGEPSTWAGFGGTSVSAPIMAGIQALANQRTGSRSGNPNSVYYQIARAEYGSSGNGSCISDNGSQIGDTCVFQDIQQGDMNVNCTGRTNCYQPSGAIGVLSTSDAAYAPAYRAANGWDFATGLGSVNANNLVTQYFFFGGPGAEIECLLNWAETAYSRLFFPPGQTTKFSSPYTYRHYLGTNSYVGVSSENNHVYYLNPDGILQDVGDLANWLTTAGCK